MYNPPCGQRKTRRFCDRPQIFLPPGFMIRCQAKTFID
ncbi:hypothetical protein TPY_2556 [Sulfobacillus acidophilus TPY]|nr:hypothetical protein TPY_2556 [Sulfobacillus acidophilus TPY]